jgi:hypothetical protein
MVMPPRPSFAATYAKALVVAARKRGWWAYVPTRLLISLGLGAAAAYFVPGGAQGFWADSNWGTSATVIGGVLAFNGILLAVGWSAFAKIYDVIGSPDFSAFLKRHDMLDTHIMFVDAVHFSLAAAALISFAALIGLLLPLPELADRGLFALMVGSCVNSIAEAFSATAMMNDLIWDKAHADGSAAGQSHLRPVSNGK